MFLNEMFAKDKRGIGMISNLIRYRSLLTLCKNDFLKVGEKLQKRIIKSAWQLDCLRNILDSVEGKNQKPNQI